ncbi:MAG: nickel-dependent lactate racemase [Clostridiaceae bacterium]|nr:nickel-dependent lactate racemase [Clostridiaceae bacterium]
MENKVFELKYGKEKAQVTVPEKNFMGVLTPEDLAGAADEALEVTRALENPIGSLKLQEIAHNKANAVILVSDVTRPVPSYKLLPPIIDALNQGGLTDDKITIIFGLGYHRKHTEEEKKKLVGEEIYSRIECIDHDIHQCINIGTTSRGTPMEIFKPVVEADLIIGTGNLEFHYNAGYSAGYKALMPGVCGKDTIEANHAMMTLTGSEAGVIEGNPMRQDIEEVGKKARMVFIVNVVLNNRKEIVKAVAGDPIQAHREGIKTLDKMYKRIIPHPADIVIGSTGGFPKDINLYQAQKGLEYCSYAVKEGGRIILLAECPEGFGEASFEDWMERARTHKDPIQWIQEKFVLGAHKAAAICMALDKAPTYLISSFDKEKTEALFFSHADTVEEALQEALQDLGEDAKVLIMPYANSTLPVVE